MMKIIILGLLFSIHNISPMAVDTVVEDWNFVKEEKGVKLYSRKIDGFDFKEVKAVLNINTDLAKAKQFLLNPDNIEKWMSGCSMSVTKKKEANKREYYAIFDAPWPVSDRDDYGVIELKHHTDASLKITFQSKPNGTPLVHSMVRVPYSKGHVIIETGKNGSKTLVYQMLVDRGGSLPSYLKDYLENSSPVNTVNELKKVLENL